MFLGFLPIRFIFKYIFLNHFLCIRRIVRTVRLWIIDDTGGRCKRASALVSNLFTCFARPGRFAVAHKLTAALYRRANSVIFAGIGRDTRIIGIFTAIAGITAITQADWLRILNHANAIVTVDITVNGSSAVRFASVYAYAISYSMLKTLF